MALPEGPQSRAEQYLAKIAGQAASLPEAPRSRVEQYLDYIAENGTVSKEEIAEQVSDWLEENIHEDPTVVIDSSLSVSGAAADSKVVGDKIFNSVPFATNIDFSNEPKFSRTINGGNAWNTISGQAYPVMLSISKDYKKVQFTPKSSSIVAFLSSDQIADSPSFSSSYPARITFSDTETKSYEIESDMNYLYILTTSNAGVDVSIDNLCFFAMDPEKVNYEDKEAPEEYQFLLANISGEKSRNVTVGEGWADLPMQMGGVFFNKQFTSTHDVQLYIDITRGVIFNRIVRHTSRTVYRDWCTTDPIAPLKVLVTGDSICRGGRNNGRGFIGDIGCQYVNIGIGGASLSTVHDSSESTDTMHRMGAANIPQTIIKYAEQSAESWYIEPDVIIAQGGINDYYQGAPLGEVPTQPVTNDTGAGALDLSTVCGALGYLLYNIIKLYPKARRFFLISNRIGTKPWTDGAGGYTQTQLHDAIVSVCKLYGTSIIDVFNDSFLNSAFSQYVSPTAYSEDTSVGTIYHIDKDAVHPLALGYKTGYAPLVKDALLKAINL